MLNSQKFICNLVLSDNKNKGDRKFQKAINFLTNRTLWFLLVSFLLAFIYAATTTNNSNFSPINGSFQNYNPARRFLSGQIPFEDFSVYLGCGEMLLDSLGLLFFGNSFTNSLFVIRFMNTFIFIGFTYIISYIISCNHRCSSLISTLLLCVVSLSAVQPNITQILEAGNSARLIRCSIIMIELSLIVFSIKIIWKKALSQDKKIIYTTIAIGIIVGSGIIWSNDYGTSSAICISIMYAIAVIKLLHNVKSVLKNAIIYILSVLSSFFITVLIITRGYILSYFESTFSISLYQKWYYRTEDRQNYKLFDFQLNVLYLFGIIFLAYSFVRMIKAKSTKDTFKYCLLSAMFLTSIFASQLYFKISGGSSTVALSLTLKLFTIIYIIFFARQIIIKYVHNNSVLSKIKAFITSHKIIQRTTILICVYTFSYIGLYCIMNTINQRNKDYNKYFGNGINGIVSPQLAEPIDKISSSIGNEDLFSTYSTAIEVYNGKFQPTGFDYIIHCLGDKNREEYIKTFNNGNYKYVSTINPTYNFYEYWIKNSNWFFYRELFSEYHPTEYTDIWILWTKNNTESTNTYDISSANITVERIDNGSVKLIVRCDNNITGTADVSLSYSTDYNKPFLQTGNINKLLFVKSVTEQTEHNKVNEPLVSISFNFCLPEESDCYYVPITVKDGYGELLITAKPDNDVNLEIKDATLNNIFRYDYINQSPIRR